MRIALIQYDFTVDADNHYNTPFSMVTVTQQQLSVFSRNLINSIKCPDNSLTRQTRKMTSPVSIKKRTEKHLEYDKNVNLALQFGLIVGL